MELRFAHPARNLKPLDNDVRVTHDNRPSYSVLRTTTIKGMIMNDSSRM